MSSAPQLTFRKVNTVIEAVCRALKESPINVMAGEPCHARAYVAEVLCTVFPKASVRHIVRLCGSRNIDKDADLIAELMSTDHWRTDVVAHGFQSLARYDLISTQDAESINASRSSDYAKSLSARESDVARSVLVAEPLPETVRRFVSSSNADRNGRTPAFVPRGRVWDGYASGPISLGEPAPGRSALDQRRAAEQCAPAPKTIHAGQYAHGSQM